MLACLWCIRGCRFPRIWQLSDCMPRWATRVFRAGWSVGATPTADADVRSCRSVDLCADCVRTRACAFVCESLCKAHQ